VCWWKVELPFHLGPQVLFPLQEAVLSAGEMTGALRVEAINGIGYVRERDGDVVSFVRAHGNRLPAQDVVWPRGWILPELHSSTLRSRTASLLSYRGVDGSLVQDWVGDMDTLGTRVGLDLAYQRPPIDVLAEPGEEDNPRLAHWWTYIFLTTDVFLPWTSNFSHPAGTVEPLDNRELAGLNAPRLNAFLRAVRAVALDLGGSWTMIPNGLYASQIDQFGVVLDAPRPD
jgi:hypothetical protein